MTVANDAVTRRCPGCGDQFTPARSTQDHCSPRCRQRSYKQRKDGDEPSEQPDLKASIEELFDDRGPIDSDSGITEPLTDDEEPEERKRSIVDLGRKYWRGIAETIGAMVVFLVGAMAASGPAPVAVHDGPIKLSADAVSGCPSSVPADAWSTDYAKAWICADAFGGVSEILTLHLDGIHRVVAVGMKPGWDYKGPDKIDQWGKFRTISTTKWDFYLYGNKVNHESVEQRFDTKSRKQQMQPVGGDVFADTVVMVVTQTCPCKSSSGGLFSMPSLNNLPTPAVGPLASSGSPIMGSSQSGPTAFAIQELTVLGHKAT